MMHVAKAAYLVSNDMHRIEASPAASPAILTSASRVCALAIELSIRASAESTSPRASSDR